MKTVSKRKPRLGVQRAVPFKLINSFNYGDHILLSIYCNSPPSAEVFGYFTINGISHTLPDEINGKLLAELKIVSFKTDPQTVNRICGSYTIGLVAYVDETLQSLVEKILKVCLENNIDPSKHKWFLSGPYTRLEKPFLIYPINFTRGYMRVEIENLNLSDKEVKNKSLIFIYDYGRKYFLSKKDKGLLDTRKLDTFLGKTKRFKY